LTFTNKDLTAQLAMGKTEERWMKTFDGEDMQVFVIYPPHFDPDKKYPAILYCKGGPQGSLSHDFHYRWNLQMFAAKGYVVVAPNPRGSFGYGQKFTDEISKDWGGKVYIDLMNAYDY